MLWDDIISFKLLCIKLLEIDKLYKEKELILIYFAILKIKPGFSSISTRK